MSSLIVEVVRIGEVEAHPNADRLEMVTVKGWNCVVGKGQFKTGDLAIYVPIDAVLPAWMIDKYELEYLKKGERVRTVRLRGSISQGLLLTPPEGAFREGENVAERLGITKWEPPVQTFTRGPSVGKPNRLRPNPNFSRYTDIENVKNFPSVFKPGDPVVVTEKIHGTNFRCGWVERPTKDLWNRLKAWLFGEYEWVVGSHNVQLTLTTPKHAKFYGGNVYHEIAHRYNLKILLRQGEIIYGEIYGDKIQDLTYGKKNGEIDVVFFDLKRGDRYLNWADFRDACENRDLPMAPVLYEGEYKDGLLAEYTDGPSILASGKHMREGVVVKDQWERMDKTIGRKVLKSVSTDYLLRKDGTEFH